MVRDILSRMTGSSSSSGQNQQNTNQNRPITSTSTSREDRHQQYQGYVPPTVTWSVSNTPTLTPARQAAPAPETCLRAQLWIWICRRIRTRLRPNTKSNTSRSFSFTHYSTSSYTQPSSPRARSILSTPAGRLFLRSQHVHHVAS